MTFRASVFRRKSVHWYEKRRFSIPSTCAAQCLRTSLLRGRHPQVIVATHSVEIISETRPNEIVMVDRNRPKSRFATSVQAVQRVCLLDSDYHTEAEIEERLREARERGVELKIWQRKEIENYLLVPQAISRVIGARVRKDVVEPTPDDVNRQIA